MPRKKKIPCLCAFTLENSVSRDRFGRPVPSEPAHYSRVPVLSPAFRDRYHIYYIYTIYTIQITASIHTVTRHHRGSVPTSSDHATTYRWRLPPRVHRHRTTVALKVARVTGAAYSGNPMNQFLCAPLFPRPLDYTSID